MDSCIALRDLVLYVSSQLDLHQPNKQEQEKYRSYSSLPDTASPGSAAKVGRGVVMLVGGMNCFILYIYAEN